jgi:calcineurin-like phosphoesterase family protein
MKLHTKILKTLQMSRRIYKAGNVWFTSDLHIGHKNIIKLCGRPYKDTHEMTEDIITKWNKKVRPEDTVFILGDIIWSVTPSKCRRFYSRLNGHKCVIWGNHDNEGKQDLAMIDWSSRLEIVTIEDDGKFTEVTLCHYPMGSFHRSYAGAIQLFGHCHGNYDTNRQLFNQVDVSWDIKLDLFSWEDIKEIITEQLLKYKKI